MRLLVFTDLDGTLLDHDDYSYAAAAPALARLQELAIPLIFVSSKTRAEIERLQEEMGLEEPFVVENGGGVFLPGRYREMDLPGSESAGRYRLLALGRSYGAARNFLRGLPDHLRVEGFGDMSLERIGELTGLSRAAAELAARREFTEPFYLEDESRLVEMTARASARGFAVTRGGRLLHLMGEQQGKGRAVEILQNAFRQHWQSEVTAIGLGDSPNDLAMLERVDIPVVIPRPDGERLQLALPNCHQAPDPGSTGWNAAILDLLRKLY